MSKLPSLFFVLLLLCNHSDALSLFKAATICTGPNWVQYGVDRCFQLVDEYVSRPNALEICRGLNPEGIPTLAVIRNPIEQAFILSMLPSNLVDNVWIGAERKRNGSFDFIWNKDGEDVGYSNWAPNRPVIDTNEDCVQLNSGYTKRSVEKGQWQDVMCSKRNLVLCEKEPELDGEDIVGRLLKLERNPVPKGFIYVQLPNKTGPSTIWPQVSWKEVTEEYGGLFFRAEGEGSKPFGERQNEGAPRLAKVQFDHSGGGLDANNTVVFEVDMPRDGWSGFVSSQQNGWVGSDQDDEYLRFFIEGSEVRPTNTAVRIWQRL